MKIIAYKPHNVAYTKLVRGCKKFFTYMGIDFYYTLRGEYREYFYHIDGTADLLDILGADKTCTLEEAIELIKRLPEEKLKQFATVDGKIKHIRQAVENKKWISRGDILFCRLVGQTELAELARINREYYDEQYLREKQQRKEQEEAEREVRKREEEEKKKKQIEQAEKDLRDGKFISSKSFEFLAAKYDIVLPIKFVGWLRKWCSEIQITKITENPPPGCVWENKYHIRYFGDTKHQSTSICSYAEKLADAIGI